MSSLVCSHVTMQADPEFNGSAKDFANNGPSVVRSPISSGWEDVSVIIANFSPDISFVMTYLLPAPTDVASFGDGINGFFIALNLHPCSSFPRSILRIRPALVRANWTFVERDPAFAWSKCSTDSQLAHSRTPAI